MRAIRDDHDVVFVECTTCGTVPVVSWLFDVHLDATGVVALYAAPCPACGEVLSGGRPDLVRQLLASGATRRLLGCPDREPGGPVD